MKASLTCLVLALTGVAAALVGQDTALAAQTAGRPSRYAGAADEARRMVAEARRRAEEAAEQQRLEEAEEQQRFRAFVERERAANGRSSSTPPAVTRSEVRPAVVGGDDALVGSWQRPGEVCTFQANGAYQCNAGAPQHLPTSFGWWTATGTTLRWTSQVGVAPGSSCVYLRVGGRLRLACERGEIVYAHRP